MTKKSDGTVSSSESKSVDSHVEDIQSGKDFHGGLISLTHQYKKENMPDSMIVAALKGMMQGCSDEIKGSDRWINRFNDIERDVAGYSPPDEDMGRWSHPFFR